MLCFVMLHVQPTPLAELFNQALGDSEDLPVALRATEIYDFIGIGAVHVSVGFCVVPCVNCATRMRFCRGFHPADGALERQAVTSTLEGLREKDA